MQRRKLLRTLPLLLCGNKAIASLQAATVAPRTAIVIGAGIAGLAAAKSLSANGYRVIVLEGRMRSGGRIFTSKLWVDQPIDLGASWIHGNKDNPMTSIATSLQIKTVETNSDAEIIYDTNGKELSSIGYRNIDTLRASMENAVTRAQRNLSKDTTLQAAIETGMSWSTRNAADKIALRYLINSEYEQDYGGSYSQMSAFWFDDDNAFSGSDLLLTNGYSAITDSLASGLDVRFGQTVKQINSQNSGVLIQTQSQTFWADVVVVTLPLGVLQSGAVKFLPPLPAKKANAIAKLGVGSLNKCVLRFDSVFWSDEYDWIGYLSAIGGQWSEWISLSKPTGRPILVGFNAGDFGRQIEGYTDSEVVASAMTTLRKIFGSTIPLPLSFQVSRWGDDPFSYGAFSYVKLGATSSMRSTLAAPVGKKVFFAGEATHRRYPGTVHGAYLSGLQAAKDVMAVRRQRP